MHLRNPAGRTAQEQASGWVNEHWDAIERVAAALSARGEFSGAEIDALIARPARKLAHYVEREIERWRTKSRMAKPDS